MDGKSGKVLLAAILAVAVWSAFQIQRMSGSLSEQRATSNEIRSLMEEDSKMATISEDVVRTADTNRVTVTTTQQSGESLSDFYARHRATCQAVINGAAP